jgi:hypothetical protein
MRRPGQVSGRDTAAGLGLVLALPVLMWWAVGDLSVSPGSAGLDYLIMPPEISAGTEHALGLSAGVLVVVGAALLLLDDSALRRHTR